MAINTQTNSDSSQIQASQTDNVDIQGLDTSISSNEYSNVIGNVSNSQELSLPSEVEELDLSLMV